MIDFFQSLDDSKNKDRLITKIDIAPAFELIEKLTDTRTYEFQNKNLPNEGTIFELVKDERCFKFKLLQKPPYQIDPTKYNFPFYILDPSRLISQDIIIETEFLHEPSLIAGKEVLIQGDIHELKTENFNDKGFFRVIIPPNQTKLYLDGFFSGDFRTIGLEHFLLAYNQFNLKPGKIGIYNNSYKENLYLIIDFHNESELIEILHLTSIIINTLGFISGQLVQGELYILNYEDSGLKELKGLKYKRFDESREGFFAISPKISAKDKIPNVIFENLVNKCIQDIKFFRAISLITESFTYSLNIRASTYSVALETLRNIIIEENEKALSPFKDKKKAGSVIKELQEYIENIEDDEFNNKEAVLVKLSNLNHIGNKESFLKMFELLSIELNEDDKKSIEQRNNFLHGRIPLEDKSKPVSDFILAHVVYKLHFLLSAVILKYCGYSGKVCNVAAYHKVFAIPNYNEPLNRAV